MFVLAIAAVAVIWAVQRGRPIPERIPREIVANHQRPDRAEVTRRLDEWHRADGSYLPGDWPSDHTPDVTLAAKADQKGVLHGRVYNGADGTIKWFELHIKTAGWSRTYTVREYVRGHSTNTFELLVGDPGVEVEEFAVYPFKGDPFTK